MDMDVFENVEELLFTTWTDVIKEDISLSCSHRFEVIWPSKQKDGTITSRAELESVFDSLYSKELTSDSLHKSEKVSKRIRYAMAQMSKVGMVDNYREHVNLTGLVNNLLSDYLSEGTSFDMQRMIEEQIHILLVEFKLPEDDSEDKLVWYSLDALLQKAIS